MVKKLQPPPAAWAGLDDPAAPRQGRSPSVALLQHSWSWRNVGSRSQCPPGAWDVPPGHSCQPSDTSNHPAGHSESPAPSNVSGPKGASASRTGLSRERAGGRPGCTAPREESDAEMRGQKGGSDAPSEWL